MGAGYKIALVEAIMVGMLMFSIRLQKLVIGNIERGKLCRWGMGKP